MGYGGSVADAGRAIDLRLDFKGKQFVATHHYSVPFRELVIDPKKSLPPKGQTPRLDDNLIIHGDNLEALKALLPRYAGKVKCIYIDPPYNTGNEGWAYNDNLRAPFIKEWLGKTVGADDLERHDKWLCMMMPRLILLRELLAEDGAIFVSIDDYETHHARVQLNEVFGEQNFIACLIRQGIKGGTGPTDEIRKAHDYVLAYAKDRSETALGSLELSALDQSDARGAFRKGRELNKWGAASRREDSPSMWFPIPGPGGQEVYPVRNDGSQGRWRWGKKNCCAQLQKATFCLSQELTVHS